ncbi:MAG TPA: methionyl-tRNA formyltransferase [Solirubrobacterales bacterium]|nr:methionyl-tRNA formyltransferase [Solirubrobacterales bacterium]
MRTVYLGTSAFAAAVLEELAAGPHRPSLVVTPPDRRRGRGRRLSPPPTARVAAELGIDRLGTADVNDPGDRERLLGVGADVGVVCAFGQLIGAELLGAIELLNLHPSLLPRWRGAAPIERAIMAGDELTGACVMKVTAGLDSGPVVSCESTPVSSGDDYGSLAGRLAPIGARLLAAALDRRGAGPLELTEQPDDGVTYAEKVEAGERRVDPGADAAAEARRIRALTPHIGAFVLLGDGSRLGVRDPHPRDSGPPPGEFAAGEEGLVLGCGAGALWIGAVQPPGGRWMESADFLRGRGVPAAARLP